MADDGIARNPAEGRWERLFADLEAQLVAGTAEQARWDVAELTRAERARIGLADRLRAAAGRRLRIEIASGEAITGVVTEAAGEWVLLDLGSGRRALVPTAAIRTVEGLGSRAAPPAGRLERALGIGHALRALARDRAAVVARTDAGTLTGRLDRVGADHVDLTLAEPAGRVVAVPFGALLAVVSR